MSEERRAKALVLVIGLIVTVIGAGCLARPGCDEPPTPEGPDLAKLGKVAEPYRAQPQPEPAPDPGFTHADLNGQWKTNDQGLELTVTIDFDRGVYSSDAPGTGPARLSLVSEDDGKIVMRLEHEGDGADTEAFSERIDVSFKGPDTIFMVGNQGVPQVFNRVK